MAFRFSRGPVLVLVVDDSLTVRAQLTRVLEGEGFRVLTAASGADGIGTAREEQADLLIVDVNMPGMNGLEMIGQVRELPGYANTPAFVLTTESSRALIKRGKEVGATAWMVKPFNADTLLLGIRKVLEIPP